jgi:probable phosphoglycerate mutase
MAERVVLVRHAETDWNSRHLHTGRTDVPLNAIGRRRARRLGRELATFDGIERATVLTSPLSRARDTCALAGFGDRAEVWPDLAEWDYGFAEGRSTVEIRDEIPDWSVWTHEVTGGESLNQVVARVSRVIARIDAIEGLVVAFTHAHIARIFGAGWCGWQPTGGMHLTIDAGGISVLGFEREARVIERWNALPDLVRRAH